MSKKIRGIAIGLLLTAQAAWADHRDQVINSASELRDWCRNESEAALIGKGLKPYNWAASFSADGNVLLTRGQWRVEAAAVTIECRVARGARAEFASMLISD